MQMYDPVSEPNWNASYAPSECCRVRFSLGKSRFTPVHNEFSGERRGRGSERCEDR